MRCWARCKCLQTIFETGVLALFARRFDPGLIVGGGDEIDAFIGVSEMCNG